MVGDEWMTPELIVIVRSNPEEAVLGSCKTVGGPGAESSFYDNCHIGGDSACPDPCLTINVS